MSSMKHLASEAGLARGPAPSAAASAAPTSLASRSALPSASADSPAPVPAGPTASAPAAPTSDGRTYWRSLADLADDPGLAAFKQHEFPGGVTDTSGFSRRRFVQLLGASMGLAQGAACRWPRENLLPFAKHPHNHTAGEPQHFATAMELGGVALPLTVTSYDGRPIKVEGNRDHPMSQGGTHAFAQASVLEIYDPDRSQTCQERVDGLQLERDFEAWHKAIAEVRERELMQGGRGLRVVSEATSSPTIARLRRRLMARFPRAAWVTYEPLSGDNARIGTAMAFGEPLRPQWSLADAKVILTLDDDLLTGGNETVRWARDYAKSRRPGPDMSRHWAIESRFSTTGAMADHRLQLPSGDIYRALCHLASALLRSNRLGPGGASLQAFTGASEGALEAGFCHALVEDLTGHLGASVISVGAGQPPHVHALAHQLNLALQNVGRTVTYLPDSLPGMVEGGKVADGCAQMAQLTQQMERGEVSTLLILGGNPAFNAPAPERFAAALAKVLHSAHLSLYDDETSQACLWHLSRAHSLESWGDCRAWDGSSCLQQPLIAPLYRGQTAAQVLAAWLGEEEPDALALTRKTLSDSFGPAVSGEVNWRDTVRRGFVSGSATAAKMPGLHPLAPVGVAAVAKSDPAAAASSPTSSDAIELTFWADSHVLDGRFANNGWLQELPDFITKITWDNAAMFAPETAKALGIKSETLVRIEVGGKTLDIAAFIQPGQAPGSVALSLGYGRRQAGVVGGSHSGKVAPAGFDTYPIWPGTAANFIAGAKITPLGKRYALATTQDHHSMDELAKQETQGRVGEIVREGTLAEYIAHPEFAAERVEHPPLISPWQEPDWTKAHRWGMSIDLNACVGCNACVVACQAENNIPIVGKEQVIRGREMHWIRIDRYYTGTPEAPQVAMQPMACQQCEMAPCEEVCPVAATVHSEEGLNDMVYNRCIGTRYCSNNCPYKVRRFNFFNYHKNLVDPRNQVEKMVYNPEVTVRARGVMEKCTYCVQRIQAVKIVAKNHKRPLTDGEFTTACQQVCPAEAIVVGDLNDPSSRVSKKHANPLSYSVLSQLNTKPRTHYDARVRNPHPQMSRTQGA